MSGKLKVTLKRSINGTLKKQRATVKALGLKKISSSHILPDRKEIRGMLDTVKHLVAVEVIKAD